MELFEQQGYSTAEDIENLKDLKEDDLRRMGVSKRGMHSFATIMHYTMVTVVCVCTSGR